MIPARPKDGRPRILHLLKWLPRGGIETWLAHVFAHSADGPFRHEVVLMQDEIGPYEDKVRSAGVSIHTLPMTSRAGWFVQLYRFLRREGPFTVFHAHVDSIVSGPALAVAKAAGVPVRLIHNHAARLMGADYQAWRHRARERLGNVIALGSATHAVGISDMAMRHLAGPGWRDKPSRSILLYGFAFTHFHDAPTRVPPLRERLSISPDAPVIGHVGRFDPVKNHRFLLHCFAACRRHAPDAVLVMVGCGPLREGCEQEAARLGISDAVRFAGGTDDVPAFMSLFDVFLFPSFSEGLGIVLLEAQAAGTPVVTSRNMPQEAFVVPEAVTRLSLDDGPEAWADATVHVLRSKRSDAAGWLQQVERSPFGIERCVRDLTELYTREIARCR